MSGGGFMLLSSNSATTEAVRIDPDKSEDLSTTSATIKLRIIFDLNNAVSTSISRRLSDLDLRY